MYRLCPECQSQIDENDKECPICGTSLVAKEETYIPTVDVDEALDSERKVDDTTKNEESNDREPTPISFEDVGSNGQVLISYTNGDEVVLKRVIAMNLYPTLFKEA